MPVEQFSPADMVVTQRRRLERSLLLLVWLGVLGFAVASGGLFHLAVGTLAVAVNWWAAGRSKEVSVAHALVNVAVVLATAVLAIEVVFRQTPALVALGHYLILIQLCKLFERKRTRDYVQLLVLSGLLMVAAALLSVSLWFAVVLAVHMAMMAWTAMVLTLKRGLDRAAAARLRSESGPLEPQRVAWNVARAWPTGPLRGRLVQVMLGVAATGLVVFVLCPRRPAAGAPRPLGPTADRAAMGFSSDVELGDVRRVYQSDEVMLEVRLRRGGAAYAPHRAVYLRGQVYRSYADSRWRGGGRAALSVRAAASDPVPMAGAQADLIEQEVILRPTLWPALFALHPVVRAELEDADGRAGRDDTPWSHRRYRAWSLPQPLTAEQARRLEAVREDRRRPPPWLGEYWGGDEPPRRDPDEPPRRDSRRDGRAERRWSRRWARRWRRDGRVGGYIEVSDRAAQLARQWCADLLARRDALDAEDAARGPLHLQIAGRLAERLRREYTYSLELDPLPDGRDGVDHFLFHTRRGHCEYFASALAVLCHALDVPVRLATGFCVVPDAEGHCLVRGRHAHAWCEVYAPQTDWVVVEATPPAGLAPAGNPSWWGRLGAFWHRVQFFWGERVAGYDEAARRRLLGGARRWLGEVGAGLRIVGRRLTGSLRTALVEGTIDRLLWGLLVGVSAAGTAVWLLVVALAVRRSWRRRRRARPAEAIADVPFARRLFRLLRRWGVGRQATRSPLEVARDAAVRLDLPPERLGELVRLYYRMRWGGVRPEPVELHAALQKVRALSRELRRRRARA